MAEHLFVYGTLRPEVAPAGLRAALAGCVAVGRGSLPGRLYDLGRYPGAVPDPAAPGRVVGEVLRLPDDEEVLGVLDAYEGFHAADPAASLFRRLALQVDLDDGRRLECWVYAYNRDPAGATLIPDGDYLGRRTGR